MGASNGITSIVNFITFLASLPVIGAGIWLATKHDTECMKFLATPVIVIGAFILLISIAGFIGSCCKVRWLLWLHLLVLFLLILLLIVFTIFTFVVTNKGAGHALSNKGFKEYRLGDYSTWLQRRVDKSSNWRRIKSCLMDAKVCKDLNKDYDTLEKFYSSHLSPTQSGCCKPPEPCGFTYKNATTWDAPATGVTNTTAAGSDCTAWNNDPKVLCFNCNSCRAGVLQNVKSSWRKVGIVNVVVTVVLIILYSVGCCAFRNSRDHGHYYKHGV